MLLFYVAGVLLLLFDEVKGQAPSNLPSNGMDESLICVVMFPLPGVQLYLAYDDSVIADYSMIHAGQFYNVDQNNDHNNINDALWCQSANNNSNIGVWYYPNGTEVPFGNLNDPSAPSPVFSKKLSGQIALARRDGLAGYEGLYKCIIPDENGVNQTLVVGAYTTSGYNNNG